MPAVDLLYAAINQTARAQEFLQPCPILIRCRANFLNHDRLHDFALHGIVSPLFRGNISPHNFAPLLVNLEGEGVKSLGPKMLERAPRHEEHGQHGNPAQGGQDTACHKEYVIELWKNHQNGIHGSLSKTPQKGIRAEWCKMPQHEEVISPSQLILSSAAGYRFSKKRKIVSPGGIATLAISNLVRIAGKPSGDAFSLSGNNGARIAPFRLGCDLF